MKDKVFNLRMTKEQHNLLRHLARLQYMTMSGYLLEFLYKESDKLWAVHPVALKSMGMTKDDLLEG